MKKTISIPETLYDITLGEYMEIEALPATLSDEEKIYKTIALLCKLSEEEMQNMEQGDLLHIAGVISRVMDSFDEAFEVERIITLDQRYGFHPNLSRLTVAEFADIETLSVNLHDNLAQIMGILYRPIVEEHGVFYRISDYDGEDRTEFFKKMKVANALGAAGFFLRTGTKLALALHSFSTEVKEGRYPKNTDGSPRLSRSQGRTLLNSQPWRKQNSKQPSRGWLISKISHYWRNKK